MKRMIPWLIGWVVMAVRVTCRFQIHNDPRTGLTDDGIPHVFAQLHAHQVAAGMAADRGTGAMVSRSEDGEMIVPALRMLGHVPIRGSAGNNARKGGLAALQALVEHVHSGSPAILAVDGPRGPRGTVHKGIGMLAKKSGAAVLAVVVVPNRRWVLAKTWDRLQIPKPFTKIHVYFSQPLVLTKGEKLDAFASRVESALRDLEMQHDPEEASRQPIAETTEKVTSDREAA